MPRTTDRKVEPKAMISELTKRGRKFERPAITMLFARATRSQALAAGGRLAMYSGVCRVRVVNRLQ